MQRQPCSSQRGDVLGGALRVHIAWPPRPGRNALGTPLPVMLRAEAAAMPLVRAPDPTTLCAIIPCRQQVSLLCRSAAAFETSSTSGAAAPVYGLSIKSSMSESTCALASLNPSGSMPRVQSPSAGTCA